MARKRMIDPNFWSSPDVSKLNHFERLILIGLISNSDDFGKGFAAPVYVRSAIFPYEDMPTKKIVTAMDNIQQHCNIQFYTVGDGRYYKFSNWHKWQNVVHPTQSKIPEPLYLKQEQFQEPFKNESRLIQETITNESESVQEPFKNDSALIEYSINKHKRNPQADEFFETVWKLYPNKNGKSAVSNSTRKKLMVVGYAELEKCITRYRDSKEEWRHWMDGSTFFNGRYADYLDGNYQEPEENPFLSGTILPGGGIML